VYSLTRLVDPRVKSGATDVFLAIKGAPEFQAGRARQVEGLTAVDRYTVEVKLADSFAPFVSMLALGHAKIVPRDRVERDAEGFAQRPVGTGPFRFSRWDRGREIALDANPDYFAGPPRLARIVFRLFAGDAWDGVYDEFVRGGLEDAPVPARSYVKATRNPDHVHVRRPTFIVRFYGFNTKAGPLADRRVRQAIIYAIDREAIVEQAHFGRYLTAKGILPPGTLGFNPALPGYRHDPARAKELLALAGFPNGKGLPAIEIWAATKEANVLREHGQIERSLAAVGVPATFHYVTEWSEFARQLEAGRLAMFQYAWHADVPDPDNFLFKLFHSQSRRNVFGYRNLVVDDLLLRARGESEIQRRVEQYRRVEQMILDDAPLVPVWHSTYERLFQKYVRSIEVNGLGDPYIPLRKLWLDKP
jgi:peptide/nickel transport system substrate-binding protein/oligopeptide transport system substrate-binding protein